MPIKVIIITTISSINVYISSTNQLIYYDDRCSYTFATRKGWKCFSQVSHQHYENCQSIHYYLLYEKMHADRVRWDTHEPRRHRKERKNWAKPQKYRVQHWKRVFNNKLNIKHDLSLSRRWSRTRVMRYRCGVPYWAHAQLQIVHVRMLIECNKRSREKNGCKKYMYWYQRTYALHSYSWGRVRAEKEKRWKKTPIHS